MAPGSGTRRRPGEQPQPGSCCGPGSRLVLPSTWRAGRAGCGCGLRAPAAHCLHSLLPLSTPARRDQAVPPRASWPPATRYTPDRPEVRRAGPGLEAKQRLGRFRGGGGGGGGAVPALSCPQVSTEADTGPAPRRHQALPRSSLLAWPLVPVHRLPTHSRARSPLQVQECPSPVLGEAVGRQRGKAASMRRSSCLGRAGRPGLGGGLPPAVSSGPAPALGLRFPKQECRSTCVRGWGPS